jgi:hypothetical protein
LEIPFLLPKSKWHHPTQLLLDRWPNSTLVVESFRPYLIDINLASNNITYKSNHPIEITELGTIPNSLIISLNLLRQKYRNDLKRSLTVLENLRKQPETEQIVPSLISINESIEKTRKALDTKLGYAWILPFLERSVASTVVALGQSVQYYIVI